MKVIVHKGWNNEACAVSVRTDDDKLELARASLNSVPLTCTMSELCQLRLHSRANAKVVQLLFKTLDKHSRALVGGWTQACLMYNCVDKAREKRLIAGGMKLVHEYWSSGHDRRVAVLLWSPHRYTLTVAGKRRAIYKRDED